MEFWEKKKIEDKVQDSPSISSTTFRINRLLEILSCSFLSFRADLIVADERVEKRFDVDDEVEDEVDDDDDRNNFFAKFFTIIGLIISFTFSQLVRFRSNLE